MNRLGMVSAAVLVASLAMGGSAAAQVSAAKVTTVNVTLHEFGIKMSKKTVPAGSNVRFVIKNTGEVVHEFVLERAGCAKKCAVHVNGHEAEIEHIGQGTTKTVTWKIAKPGKYALTCRRKGHHEAGMFVNFAVN